jgi:hypothetical protein
MRRHTVTITISVTLALVSLAASTSAQQPALARDLLRLIGAAPSMFEPLRGRAVGSRAFESDIVIEGMQGGQFEVMSDGELGYYNSSRMDEARRAEALYEALSRGLPAAVPSGWTECRPSAPLNPRAVDVRRRTFVDSSNAPTTAVTITLSARRDQRLVTLTVMSFPRHPELSPCHR